jgi:parallel beta-helix repeat protein
MGAEGVTARSGAILAIAGLLVAASLVISSLLVGAVTACMSYTQAAFIPDNGALIGVSYNPAESEQDIKDLQSFENWSGKKHSIVVIFQAFSPDEHAPLPRTQMDNLWQNGNTPLLTLEPWGSADILDVINNGMLDSYFEKYARDLKNWTHESWTVNGASGERKQLFLRFAHEMNLHDEAYPWSNKSPSSYKNAWRRVHTIFEEQGLTRGDVQWVWCVSNYDVPFDGYKAEEYYPGDDYVDWVGIDGYNTGESVPYATWDRWENFSQRFKHMLDRFDNHSTISKKPYGIFELGSSSVVEANTVNGPFNVFTNTNSPTNHYIPSGWMGDWQDITYEEATNDYPQEISCGDSSIKVTYHTDPDEENHYIPSGWTGGDIGFNDGYDKGIYSGSTCIRINYVINKSWAGIYWQDPANNWGDKEGGYNLTGAENLTFAAKGESGGEIITFSMGGADGTYPDSASASIVVNLTDTWAVHTINLSGKNVSHIITGFGWIAAQATNPDGCTFYLDDIKYRYEDKNFSIYTDKREGWAGIYWQDPENNWGNKEGGFDLTEATKLLFWAKDAQECKGSFMMGGVSGTNSSDTADASIEVNLTGAWKKHAINLSGMNLSNIITGFGCVVGKSDNPRGCILSLDEIRYENVSVVEGVSNNTKKGEWVTETYNAIKKYPKIKMVCYFNIDKGGTKYLTGESDWAVFTTPRDNRNNIDDCSFDPNKRISHYNASIKEDYYFYQFPLYSENKTIYVDDDFTDDPENHKWNSIQEGINDAYDGYTVFVYNGTYYENVAVNKSLILTGENRNTTIIDGGGEGDGVNVTADNCAIGGFTVRNSGSKYSGNAGIIVKKSSSNNITDNAVYSNSNKGGIYLCNSSNNAISGNIVVDNNGGGISLSDYSSNNAISGNTVVDNNGGGISLSDYSNNNTISGNTVVDNGGGISLSHYSGNTTISGNTVLDSGFTGIDLYYGNNKNIIVGNNVSDNGRYAIYLRDYNNNNIIVGNNVFANNEDGIYIVWDCNYNNITGNTVLNNDGEGIYRQDVSGHNSIMNNTISANKGDGILLHWLSHRNIITGNTVTNNQNGITIRYSSDSNIITNNTVSSNNGTGISLPWVYFWGTSDDNVIYHNNLINNVKQAYDDGTNSWDNGLVDGGNYWSDHTCTGNPSNGSQPYIISGNGSAQDRFPFMNESGWLKKPRTIFDTGEGTYPSITGVHRGTLTPGHGVYVDKLYTYPCKGTGGHSEYVTFYNATTGEEIANGTWNGYTEDDCHYITFDTPFTLKVNVTYNYTIKTGSYPEIHHTDRLKMDDGVITCTSFVDANGRRYNDWIPAIRLE